MQPGEGRILGRLSRNRPLVSGLGGKCLWPEAELPHSVTTHTQLRGLLTALGSHSASSGLPGSLGELRPFVCLLQTLPTEAFG